MQLQTFTMLTEFSGGTQDIPPSNFILSPLIGASYLGCLSLRIGLHLKLEGSNKFLFGDRASPLSQGLDDPRPPLISMSGSTIAKESEKLILYPLMNLFSPF